MVSQAIVIAIAVTANGEREVLGLDVGPSEGGAFWLAFLRDLAARGLSGVKLAISDAHAGWCDESRTSGMSRGHELEES